LPGTMYFAMTAIPALIAWLSPGAAVLKRNLSLCYLASAAMLAALAVVLLVDVSDSIKLGMVILQGAVSGAVMPAAIAFLWEAIGRGSDESRRGLALGLAFGAGPLLAVAGSLIQAWLLGTTFFGREFAGLAWPWNFVVLFGGAVPCLLLAALLSRVLVVPLPESEPPREPVGEVAGLLLGLPLLLASVGLAHVAGQTEGGLYGTLCFLAGAGAALAFIWHFRSILTQRTLLLATVVTILVYMGNMIPSNMNLYSPEVLGDSPERYAGTQNALRFSFKVVAGFLLGWMLTRTSPRAGVLATSAIFLAAQLWAMFATGTWYLLAFGLYGAGELVGVYAPNYILSASRPQDLRRNMAFMTMLMVPAAPAGYLYGVIVDVVRRKQLTWAGMNSDVLGFRLSFLVCALLILSGIILALVALPKKPRPAG
ncbi:MAG: hypothetical protein KDA79_16390, partial [Planctomycetaceae bacterium]|nr:hypothetical protein [Planctomycetaceae bacterium]